MKMKTTARLITWVLLFAGTVQAGLYSDKVADLNARVYYQLDQGAGAADGSAVANVGTLGASYNGTWGSGLSGYPGREAISGAPRADSIGGQALNGLDSSGHSAQFNPGSNSDMISLNIGGEGGAPTAFDTAAQTISLFFKTTQTNGYGRIYTTDPDCTHTFTLEMGADYSGYEGRIYLAVGTSSSDARYSAHEFNDGNWHHLVAVRGSDSRADLKLYVDGVEETLANSSANFSAGYQARFGAHGTASGGFEGYMDEIAVWDSALTSTESQDLYTAAIPEPAALGLLATCGAALLFIRRKLEL